MSTALLVLVSLFLSGQNIGNVVVMSSPGPPRKVGFCCERMDSNDERLHVHDVHYSVDA